MEADNALALDVINDSKTRQQQAIHQITVGHLRLNQDSTTVNLWEITLSHEEVVHASTASDGLTPKKFDIALGDC